MAAAGYVQGAADSTGKKVQSVAVTLPAGTVVTNQDGTTTTLGSDTVVYLQAVALMDPENASAAATIRGETQRGALLVDAAPLARIAATLDEIKMMIAIVVDT